MKKEEVKKEEVKKINPTDYFYKPDVNVEIPGNVLLDMMALVDKLIQKEVRTESKFKFNYIDKHGRIVKKFNDEDIKKGLIKKVVDFKRTIDEPTMETTITPEGIAYSKLKIFLESVHYDNIQKKVATSIYETDLYKQKKD